MPRLLLLLLVLAGGASASILNANALNPALFRVTEYATNLSFPNSVLAGPGNSLLAVLSPAYTTAQVVRFTDLDFNGVADGPPSVLYSNSLAGPGVQLRQGGELYYLGEFGAKTITVLAPGANPQDPLTLAGRLEFGYAPGHYHPTPGFAVRPTPGVAGSIDLVFNVGSQFNDQLSTEPVTLSGLGLPAANLIGDSLYMLTIAENGGAPTASNLRQVATGVRNVYGLGFDPATGDLYFADNAIDEGSVTTTSEPPQADELNRIPAADLGAQVLRFGYPDCYRAYRSNALVETTPGGCAGVTESLINFQPVPSGPGGFRTEGPAELAFSPALFPAAFQNGIFVGFSGGQGPGGVNNQNGVVFVDAGFSQLLHFIESGTPGLGNLLGIHSTADSLFVADWSGGTVFQITAATIPEPASWAFFALALVLIHARPRLRF